MTNSSLAVIGGTGEEGSGLALRWAASGYRVLIGSRSRERAVAAAAELRSMLPPELPARIRGDSNAEAAAAADVIVLSVPYESQAGILEQIREGCEGKTVVSVVVPLRPPRVSRVWRPPGGSAAEEAQAVLGDGACVVAAFQNISATHLKELDHAVDCDILVTGNDRAAKLTAIELAQAAGMRGIDAGPLVNSSVSEGLTAVLIGINIRNKVKGSGLRITGV
ncbi:MAG: NADPH-dependent F420 reductase [Caldilineaceae bacterium SB0670_bin_27]|uniref:NADPH-dependent F420 reductase n=1 Tax=Caldilineaceae bacterium SB0664_bin_27 TaxID=2605260 RepID=A0A6B0YUC3_9CHLR|nr:NADPH-dependent F420 reductase [Caldilineaceae bacterium SB0664_bin_27]MYJ79462.1 NADPH-dependent F420 reductase [Caldilineaceae bacterium SB0670_bin_27]